MLWVKCYTKAYVKSMNMAIDDDAWRETMNVYEEMDQDDFGAHVLNVWYALMPLSWKNAMKENDGTNQFPFDPGGWMVT